MTTVHHRFATVNGRRLFYRKAGPPGATVLVLLHGFSTSSFMFRHLIPMLRGLAIAKHARSADCAERASLLAELDEATSWRAARAAEMPDNFMHRLRLLEAERASAIGDFRARPWHRAFIAEHAPRFHLGHGLKHTGHELLAAARQTYLDCGATANVDQLDLANPTLRPPSGATAGQGGDQPADPLHTRGAVTTGTLDLLGILAASQALSSETSIERLHARVVDILSTITGATGVHLLLWNDERQDWLLPLPDSDTGTAQIADTARLAVTVEEHVVPLSVLRYAQRLSEPLVVPDATHDDRFASDPYFGDLGCCSLLALPILSRGTLRAVLLLENRLIRAAFTAERLDAVNLIACQLAVSLDNAHLYTELTASRARIVATADHTCRRIEHDLHDGAQQRLIALALQARAAHAAAPPDATDLQAQLADLAVQAVTALRELREFARGIHPAILTQGGLHPALRALARRCPVPVELDMAVGKQLPEQVEIAAYYLVAESLSNTAKHAHASFVHVEITQAGDSLQIRVCDDGRGGADLAAGSGLIGLRDRAEALGGRLSVQSAPGAGTTVQAELPLSPAHTGGS